LTVSFYYEEHGFHFHSGEKYASITLLSEMLKIPKEEVQKLIKECGARRIRIPTRERRSFTAYSVEDVSYALHPSNL
jgi:hypothetical protein